MNEALSKFFDKVPTDKIYEDLLQPGLKKAGFALETVLDFGNTLLLPLKLANETTKLRLNQHLKNYEEKLKSVPDEDLHKVPEYVGAPIINKLILLDSNDLSEAFINLLTKASTSSTIGLVHPAFVQVLENLSVDEARILFHHKNSARIPFINLNYRKYKELIKKPENPENEGPKSRDYLKQLNEYTFQDRHEVMIEIGKHLTSISTIANIDFPENAEIYIENLHRLGLIEFISNKYNADDKEVYSELEGKLYKNDINAALEVANEFDEPDSKLEYFTTKGYIIFSQYGQAFLKACVTSIGI